MVPGFMRLSQDDQIVLLKTGSFELVVLRMSRYYDLAQNAVLFGDTLLPVNAFLTPDTVETKLVGAVFKFAKELAELKLSEVQLGLYSAFVLLSHGASSLKLRPRLCVDALIDVDWSTRSSRPARHSGDPATGTVGLGRTASGTVAHPPLARQGRRLGGRLARRQAARFAVHDSV